MLMLMLNHEIHVQLSRWYTCPLGWDLIRGSDYNFQHSNNSVTLPCYSQSSMLHSLFGIICYISAAAMKSTQQKGRKSTVQECYWYQSLNSNKHLTTSTSVLECPMLQTMHPFFILSMWSLVTTCLLPILIQGK